MEKTQESTTNVEPKDVWETPVLISEEVVETTQAGFADVLVENMFYTDS